MSISNEVNLSTYPKDVSEDLSHSDTRLSVQLNGFELHVYNRSEHPKIQVVSHFTSIVLFLTLSV